MKACPHHKPMVRCLDCQRAAVKAFARKHYPAAHFNCRRCGQPIQGPNASWGVSATGILYRRCRACKKAYAKANPKTETV